MPVSAQPAPAERSFLFLIASGRRGGNTELLARVAAESLPAATAQTWLHLADLPLPAFRDLRHDPAGYPQQLDGNAQVLFDATLAASDLVFVAPSYWYGMPAGAQLYLDHWAHWLRIEGAGFDDGLRGKTFWLIAVQTAEEIARAGPLVTALKFCAEYCGASWGGSVIGYGSAPGDVLEDSAALEDAGRLFRDGGDLWSSFAGRA